MMDISILKIQVLLCMSYSDENFFNIRSDIALFDMGNGRDGKKFHQNFLCFPYKL